jgi:hypothetical protein
MKALLMFTTTRTIATLLISSRRHSYRLFPCTSFTFVFQSFSRHFSFQRLGFDPRHLSPSSVGVHELSVSSSVLSRLLCLSELLGFRTLSTVRHSENCTTRFGKWIWFRRQVNEVRHLLRWVPKKELTSITWVASIQWLKLPLSKSPNRFGVFFPSPENGIESSFRKVFSSF